MRKISKKFSTKISTKSKRKFIVIALVLLVMYFIFGLFSCGKKIITSRPPVVVVMKPAVEQDIPVYVTGIGHCSAIESVKIVPEVTGRIISVNFKQGDQVSVGDVLYVIDKRQYEAAVSIAQAQYEKSKAQYKISLARLERSRSLVPQNYISKQEFEAIEEQANCDKSSVDAAEGQLKQAQINLEDCTITSPINGIAGSYGVDVGNVVSVNSPQSPQVLTTVENIEKMYVDFAISENHFADLQKYFKESNGCLNAEVEHMSDKLVKANATVKFIDNKINKSCGVINLRAVIDNSERIFWAGQSVRVQLNLYITKNAVLVPVESVKLGQKGHYVFVVKEDNTADLRLVSVGQRQGEMLTINQGVSAKENIVVRGQLMLAPGFTVVAAPDNNVNMFQQKLESDKKTTATNPTTN